jgi:hypothetical protein
MGIPEIRVNVFEVEPRSWPASSRMRWVMWRRATCGGG